MKNLGIRITLADANTFYVWVDDCDVDLTDVIKVIRATVIDKAGYLTTAILSAMRPWATKRPPCVGSRPAGLSEFKIEIDLLRNCVILRRVSKMPVRMKLGHFLTLPASTIASMLRLACDIIVYQSEKETIVTTVEHEPLTIEEFFTKGKRDLADYTRIEIDGGDYACTRGGPETVVKVIQR